MTPATTMPTTIAVRNGVATRLTSGIASSFSLAGCFIRIAAKGGAGLGDELRAAAFDRVAGFGDDVLQDFENLAHTVSRSMSSGRDLRSDASRWMALEARNAPAVGSCFMASVI